MSGADQPINRVAQMREEFDRSFAMPPAPASPPVENLLAIRIAQEPYALRLAEIAGVFADRVVTRLPGRMPALLGISGFRGLVVPVYDLAALLGHASEQGARWLALAAGTTAAFAFPAFDGHLRIPTAAIVADRGDNRARPYVRHYARADEMLRPIVHLASVLEAIRQQVPKKS